MSVAMLVPDRQASTRGGIGPFRHAGAPAAGTDEIQTLTFGGTPTGGTFKLRFRNQVTAAISWSATNNTLRDNIDAALEALSTIGTGGVTTTVGTMTSGVGTMTVTFAGALVQKLNVPLLEVFNNSLTGTAPTLAVTETTPGVDATGRGAAKGAVLIDTTNGLLYLNAGTPTAPDWEVGGALTPQAAITALTFTAVSGTANNALEALADPTDSPADADALRDDLVANLLPKLRNNFADLASKINELQAALHSGGVTG